MLIRENDELFTVGTIAFDEGAGLVDVHPFKQYLDRETVRSVRREVILPLNKLQDESPVTDRPPSKNPLDPHLEVPAGLILLQRASDDTGSFRLYVADRDVEYTITDLEAYKRPLPVRRFLPGVGPSGELLDLQRENVQSARNIAAIAEVQYKLEPDRFLGVLEVDPIFEWGTDSIRCMARFPEDEFEVLADVRFAEAEVDIEMKYDHQRWPRDQKPFAFDDVLVRLRDGTLRPVEDMTPRWLAEYATAAGFGNIGQLKSKAYRLLLEYASGDVVATREILRGVSFHAFSHRVLGRHPNPIAFMTTRNAFSVAIFDREARIYNIGDGHVGIVHDGPPLDENKRVALIALVSYLAGNRAEHVSTELFGKDERLSFEFHARGGATKRGQPPLVIDPWHDATTLAVGAHFGNMLQSIHNLYRAKPMKLEAALHHYFEGANSDYPTSRILMFAVAIDTLVALRIGTDRDVPIIDRETYARLTGPLRRTFDLALRTGVPEDAKRKLLARFDNLNNASATQRQRDFWRSLAITLTREEERILASRHEVSHEGHVGDERTRDSLIANQYKSDVLCNLFNRAFLTMLGWTGKYRDATSRTRDELPLAESPLNRRAKRRDRHPIRKIGNETVRPFGLPRTADAVRDALSRATSHPR